MAHCTHAADLYGHCSFMACHNYSEKCRAHAVAGDRSAICSRSKRRSLTLRINNVSDIEGVKMLVGHSLDTLVEDDAIPPDSWDWSEG